MSNIIAIVGRPNVGKSTFFNRLTESHHAIVDEISGVTRDRIYGKVDWNGSEFSIIDTGGYVNNSDDIFEGEIKKQVLLAIEEADIVLFLVDVVEGVTEMDTIVAQMLRKSNKTVFLVVNKVDNTKRIQESYEFYKLGLGEPFCVSSMNGSGTGELLDAVVLALPNKSPITEDLEIPKFAIIGKPNVGKSSFVNALIGTDRNIVTPIAGTTRDSIYTRYNKFNKDFYLIDTAGIRKKTKVSENLEFYSVMRAIRAIEASDVCLLLLDATDGMESQDVNIFHLVHRNKKGLVVLVNKWDLVEKNTATTKEYTALIKERTAPLNDIPIIFTSVLTKQRIHKAIEEAILVFENRRRKIPTAKLNSVMLAAIEASHPPTVKGKSVKIKYVTQLPTPTPVFAFFCNLPQYIKDPYKRYLENRLRENFNFTGVPIQLVFRKK
jgi:GTPase